MISRRSAITSLTALAAATQLPPVFSSQLSSPSSLPPPLSSPFLSYIQHQWWNNEETPYDIPPHIRACCAALDAVENGTTRRLALSLPPRHGATTLTAAFCGYYHALHPTHTIHYSNVLSPLRHAALAGRRIDLFVIDGQFRCYAEAQSARCRAQLWNWYCDVVACRTFPHGRVLIFSPRQHPDDLLARLKHQEPGAWTMLSFPALRGDDGRTTTGTCRSGAGGGGARYSLSKPQ